MDSRIISECVHGSFPRFHQPNKNLSEVKIINPIYNDKTYIEMILIEVNKLISSVIKMDSTPNYKLIFDKYISELARLHYIAYSLVDIYKNGINEYHAYRDLLNNLKAMKFSLYVAADLFKNINHYIEPVTLNHIYDLIDKLNELNKDNEALFIGENSSIFVEA